MRSAAQRAAAVAATASASRSGPSGRRLEAIVAWVELADAAAGVEREVGPHHRVAPIRVEVPAPAAPGVPDGPGEPFLQVVVPVVLYLRLHLQHGPAVARVHGLQSLHHVADLR